MPKSDIIEAAKSHATEKEVILAGGNSEKGEVLGKTEMQEIYEAGKNY